MKDFGIQVNDNPTNDNIMDLKTEVHYDSSGKIIQGVILGNTLEQNKAFLLLAQPNDLKGNPTLGVGIEDLLLSGDLLEYRHKIREHFNRDGLIVDTLDLYNLQNINIEAHYE